jgi:hypothetical protein
MCAYRILEQSRTLHFGPCVLGLCGFLTFKTRISFPHQPANSFTMKYVFCKVPHNTSLTLRLDGGGRSNQHPGRFTVWKDTRYLLYKRPHRRSGPVLKTLPRRVFELRTVQPAGSRYTNYVILCRVKVKIFRVLN